MRNIENMNDICDALITSVVSVGTEFVISKFIDTSKFNFGQKTVVDLFVTLACTGAVKASKITISYVSKKLKEAKKEVGDGRA